MLHLQMHLQNCESLARTLCQLGNMGFIYLLFGGVLSDAEEVMEVLFGWNNWFGKHCSSLVWAMVPLFLMWVT